MGCLEVNWMTAYFSGAVWVSHALVHLNQPCHPLVTCAL
jgi:hypothetical protein